MIQRTLKTGFLVILTLSMVVSLAATPGLAQSSTINTDADAAPNAELEGNVTIDGYEMAWSGLQYENDAGDVTDFPGRVDPQRDNPYSFIASDVNFSDAEGFPHANESVSALDSDEWSASGANSSKMTISDVETAPGKDALRVSTSSMAAGDTATATFSDVSITSDENKRYLQLVLDANTVDSGVVANVSVVDSDGDHYDATLDPSADSENTHTITTATGEGVIFQQQLGDMDLIADGDGSFNDISKVEIVVTEADAEVDISAINVDKTSPWVFGEELKDNDDDDDLEEVEIKENQGGALSLHSLSSIGPAFDSATILGLTVDFKQTAADLDSEDVSVEFEEADQYPNFEHKFNGHFRYEAPDAYDLSYANLEVVDEVARPGSRYETVEYAEGTGDTEFDDIDPWTGITSSYGSMSSNVTVTTSVSAGSPVVLHFEYVVTDDEKNAIENVGGAMGPTGDDEGGFLSMLFSLPGVIVSGVAAFLGGRRLGVF